MKQEKMNFAQISRTILRERGQLVRRTRGFARRAFSSATGLTATTGVLAKPRTADKLSALPVLWLGLIFCACFASVGAQTTAFTYQGRFTDSTVAQPTSGTYQMQFALFDAASAPVGAAITVPSVSVVNGIFTVNLDFGASAFPANAERLLEIRVFNTTTAAFVPLSPRQPLTSAPYAIRSKMATTADVSTDTLNVGGTPAADIITEGDARLTDTRTPTAGSGNYIQNQNTAAQTSTNFSIDGTGAANIFSAATQFNIGGNRVFSIGGSGNTFAGLSSGAANPTGNNNSFFGREAGLSTTTGVSNSFFGNTAGRLNLGGNNNSFFGRDAGRSNETGNENSFFGVNAGLFSTGSQNVFLGVQAGSFNTAGSNNTVIGTSANVSAGNLSFATAIGSGAVVGANNTIVLGRNADTVQIPGTISGGGAGLTNLNASNIATGTLNNARLGVVPIANGGTGSATQNFVDLTTAQTIAGNKTFSATLSANAVNAGQYNTEGLRAFAVDGLNTFGGFFAGETGTGNHNTFFGREAGRINSASFNTFIGSTAGRTNGGAANNTFVGFAAGAENLSGTGNSFLGSLAGQFNSAGSFNSIFGYVAGISNSGGSYNSFFGNNAAFNNTSGSNNSFFGVNSGKANTLGSLNTFVGDAAGLANTAGSNNTVIGAGANLDSSSLNYATAVGAGATAFGSNGIYLGRTEDRVVVRSGRIALSLLNGGGNAALCFNTSLGEIAGCSSSLRYKTNIAPFSFGLNLVKQLQPITFDWKADGMHDLGLGAEDVAAIEPLLVTYNKTGQIEGVKYDRIGVVLLNAVKEQQTQIEDQAKQLAEQKLLIDGLKKLVCQQNSTAAVCQ